MLFSSWKLTYRVLVAAMLFMPGLGCQNTGGVETLASRVDLHGASDLERRFGGRQRDPAAHQRLDHVGRSLLKVVPGLPSCCFALLKSEQLNALSLPAGQIYITAGLYDHLETDDLLAAALAHELAHIAVQDGLHPRKSDRAKLRKEIAADARAAQYLSLAGYNPHVLIDLVQIVEKEQKAGWARQRVAALLGRLGTSPYSLAAHQ